MSHFIFGLNHICPVSDTLCASPQTVINKELVGFDTSCEQTAGCSANRLICCVGLPCCPTILQKNARAREDVSSFGTSGNTAEPIRNLAETQGQLMTSGHKRKTKGKLPHLPVFWNRTTWAGAGLLQELLLRNGRPLPHGAVGPGKVFLNASVTAKGGISFTAVALALRSP